MLAARRGIRWIHTIVEAPRLTRFTLKAPKNVEEYPANLISSKQLNRRLSGQLLEVEYTNGSKFNLSAEFLRIHSPAVDGKVRSIGGEKVIFGRRHVGIMSADPVGNYGVRMVFDDLHKTGIYTWDYFYQLGNNKLTLMRNYIKTLRKHGLSRDPPKRK